MKVKQVTDESRVKGLLLVPLGAGVYQMGLDLAAVNDISAIWFAALGIITFNFGFYLLDQGEI